MCLFLNEGWRDQPPEPDGWEAEGADAQAGGGLRTLFYSIWWFDWMTDSSSAITNMATKMRCLNTPLKQYLNLCIKRPEAFDTTVLRKKNKKQNGPAGC